MNLQLEQQWSTHLQPFKNKTLIVGCSGGIDSIVLVHFLADQGFTIHVVHVNYHKRANDSNLDQEFVENTCKNLKIKCSVVDFKENTHDSGNFQEAARDFRYAIFKKIGATYPDFAIVLAHHADDQIETFLMNLIRGSGVLGLAAMPMSRNSVVRPFLNTFKSRLHRYATEKGIAWKEDATNLENNYTRNKWRNEFIPFIEKEIPTIKESILFLIQLFQEKQKELSKKVNPLSMEIHQTNSISIDTFHQLSSEEKFELWRQLKQDASTFPFFEELPKKQKGKFIEMKGDFENVIRENQTLYFSSSNDEFELPQLLIEKVNSIPEQFSKNEIYLHSEKILGDLHLRPWKTGDRITPIGMKGSQLVSDIIKDAKIPSHLKATILVLEDAQRIHWVVGLKIGRYAIGNSPKNLLKISILESKSHKS